MRQEKVVVDGKEYKLQAMPLRDYMKVIDRCSNNSGNLMKEAYSDALLENCVIEPKVKLEDFDEDFASGMALVAEVERFLSSTTNKSEKLKK